LAIIIADIGLSGVRAAHGNIAAAGGKFTLPQELHIEGYWFSKT
jgi:hypothetical protein